MFLSRFKFKKQLVPTTSVEDLKLCCLLFTWSLKENTVPFTWKTSVICSTTTRKNKKNKSFLFKWLSFDCFDIYCNEVFWTYHSPTTHETHKPHLDPYQFAYKHNRSTNDTTLTLLHNAYILILKNQVHLSEFSSLTFLLPSIPYNHTSWYANFWNSMLTQDCQPSCQPFSHSSPPSCTLVILLYFHRLSTRHCPVSYSLYILYKWLHRHWHNTNHKILWWFCSRRSFQLRFCLFCWSWEVH